MDVPAPKTYEVELDKVQLKTQTLRQVKLVGYGIGQPLGTAPTYLLMGGITASPFPFGTPKLEAWWPALCAEDLVDPEQHTILTFAWPGNGSSWQGFTEAYQSNGTRQATLSVLDLADLIEHWLAEIEAPQRLRYVGASLGGLIGMALAVRHPRRVSRLVTVSAGLRPEGWGTAIRHLQRAIVNDRQRQGDEFSGLVLARQLGMLTYRGREEINRRFGPLDQEEDLPPVASYLQHHGEKFAENFPAATFLALSEAIDRCHLAPTREAVREQLAGLEADVYVVGVPSDLLFPFELQIELHREIQATGATSSLYKLESEFGHDAFLADQERLADLLRTTGAFHKRGVSGVRPRFEGVGKAPTKELRIGMVGCGVVGQSVLELLEARREELRRRYQTHFVVRKLAVRDVNKTRGDLAVSIQKTDNALSLATDPDLDVIVEVAGGVDTMLPVVRAALSAGKPVVTANKNLLAEKLGELAVLSHRTNTPLACEAAAAAALPIVRALARGSARVVELVGIVNGTCNYILTRVEQDGLSLEEAIRKAQELGLAEANPIADVGGFDAAAKLSILVYRAFGVWTHPQEYAPRGIEGVSPTDCELARNLGYRVRQVVFARDAHSQGVEFAVEPMLLPEWHLLASVEEEYNAVYLSSELAGDLSFFGKGAGGPPTASAIVTDLIDIAQNTAAPWPEPREATATYAGLLHRRHYLRLASSRIEQQLGDLVRKHKLEIEARKQSKGGEIGLVLSPCSAAKVAELRSELLSLDGQASPLSLAVFDGRWS